MRDALGEESRSGRTRWPTLLIELASRGV